MIEHVYNRYANATKYAYLIPSDTIQTIIITL